MRIKIEILEYKAQILPAVKSLIFYVFKRLAVKICLAGSRKNETGQNIEKRALAAAARAFDPDELAFGDCQTGVV